MRDLIRLPFGWTRLSFALPVLSAAFACSSGTEQPGGPTPPAGDVFESANPGAAASSGDDLSGGGGRNAGSGGTGSGGTLTTAPGAEDGGDEGGDPARAIEEADIINITDGRLYALSRYGGLSVIDVSVRDQLKLLGRHKVVATPFEMYVRDGIVFALYNGFSEYSYDENEELWTYYQTSHVVVLDARNPSSITELSRFAIPGSISDSRIVGDVLYVAAYEDGYCWGCGDAPRTNLLSLDVAAPADIQLVDELGFDEREDTYSWKRSLTATDERLYLAGPTWGANEPVGSTIQVVDISDPDGDMELGAAVEVGGQIQSRWQMDETDGVLRVISQPFTWRSDVAPVVQTFRVESSASVTPLGSTTLVLPRAEQLQSVRFDGDRAYAITFEQTDPLFTIDLSDPAAPRQTGELEMPGFLYHMEPRGDRLVGLGFDQGNEDGAITVSLFDVSDLANPTMLSRVNFGGDWGSLAEDQDRIHKAFKLLDDDGLILVPFSGYSYDEARENECWSGVYSSGVQLVDWQADTLTLQGVAASIGEARRGLVHDGRLLTMSDERVESFDISNRAEPQKTAELAVAQLVTHTAGVQNGLVRVSQNWWTNTTRIDVSTLAGAESPASSGQLELPQLDSPADCYSSSWLGDVHSNGSHAYLMYQTYEYLPELGRSQQRKQVLTIDVSDPTAPKLAGDAPIEITSGDESYGYYGSYGAGLVSSGSPVVNVGSTLAVSARSVDYSGNTPRPGNSELKLVGLADPANPSVITVPLPPSLGYTGLLASGSIVATSHQEPSPLADDRVRFYLDRVNVMDPAEPVLLPSVNIPGSLVAYDAASAHAVTADYQNLTIPEITWPECRQQFGGAFRPATNAIQDDISPGTCLTIQQTLRLVAVTSDRARIVDSYTLPPGEQVTTTALGDDRLFVSVGKRGYYYGYGVGGAVDDGYYYASSFASGTAPLVVLSGIRSGSFASARLELEAGDSWGYVPLVASGKSAALSTGFRGKLVVVDASNVRALRVAREVELDGYVQDLDVVGNSAVASLGYDGVKTLSLAP